jgi:hypothetical protein
MPEIPKKSIRFIRFDVNESSPELGMASMSGQAETWDEVARPNLTGNYAEIYDAWTAHCWSTQLGKAGDVPKWFCTNATLEGEPMTLEWAQERARSCGDGESLLPERKVSPV